MIDDKGVASCVDGKSGKVIWQKRIGGGEYRASPILANGRIYVFGAKGDVKVFAAKKEFELLAYFVDHPHRACSRGELLRAVWESNSGWQNESTVTEHVYRLRLKVEDNPQRPERLRTVRSVGYRWEP